MGLPIIGPILDIIHKGIDKIIPDANEKQRLKHEMQKYLLELPMEQWKRFEKRVALEVQHPLWYRDAVRPTITFTAWAMYCYIKVTVIYYVSKIYIPLLSAIEATQENIPILKTMLADYVGSLFTWYDLMIISGILGFWFGPKAFERVVEKFSNMKDIKTLFLGKGG